MVFLKFASSFVMSAAVHACGFAFAGFQPISFSRSASVRGTFAGQSVAWPESSSAMTARSLAASLPVLPLELLAAPSPAVVSSVVDEQPDAVTVVIRPAIADTLASANNFLVTITRLLELLSRLPPP